MPDMCYQPGEPVQSSKNFSGFSILGGVNNFGNAIIEFFYRDINHFLLNIFFLSLYGIMCQESNSTKYRVLLHQFRLF